MQQIFLHFYLPAEYCSLSGGTNSLISLEPCRSAVSLHDNRVTKNDLVQERVASQMVRGNIM